MTNPIPSLSESRSLRAGVFFGLYAVQGIPSGFALTAVANYLTERGLNPEIIAAFAARIGIPWAIQFAWGPLIDRFQGSPMGRRRPWVMGTQFAAFLASLGLLAVRDPVADLTVLSIAFVVHGLFASIQDASVDAMAISTIPKSERGRVNAFMRAGALVGGGAGAALWSMLIHRFGFQGAALAQSCVLLAMTGLTFFVVERPGDALMPWGRRTTGEPQLPSPATRTVFVELARGLLDGRSLMVFGVVLLVNAVGSVFIRAFFWHLIHVLDWGDERASVYFGTYGTLAGLAILIPSAVYADRIGSRRLVVAMMVVIGGFLLGFGALGPFWHDRALATAGLVIWCTFDPAFSVASMPVLMALCRRGVEGSQFTAYMSMVNLANLGGTYASGLAQLHVDAPTIGVACGLAIIAAIPLAAWSLGKPDADMPEIA